MPAHSHTPNTLYFGDNLDILREHIADASVDLVYLDPPFNSDRNYNILFKDEHGNDADAQLKAFADSWYWNSAAERVYHDLVYKGPVNVAQMIGALRGFLGTSQMTAYLVMMSARLVELHRVLKPTGSLYLHCDPTASHYLKIILDTIFGPKNFRNEIIWRRTGAHVSKRSFGTIHDTILFYSKSNDYYFDAIAKPYMRRHVEKRYTVDATGRAKFTSGGNVLTGPGATNGESGKCWRGFNPSAKNRHWAIPGYLSEKMPPAFSTLSLLAKLDALYDAKLIEIKEGSAWPTPVRYLDDNEGQLLQDIWAYQPYTEKTVYGTDNGIDEDVKWLGPTDPERLGYQTQKPVGLLERIIRSSCPASGTVLDAFCGCGTAIAAAQKLGRRWLGIDITHLAITIQRSRLKEMFPDAEYRVIGEPVDLASACALAIENRYQFQYWALSLVQARPLNDDGSGKRGKKGMDRGIDGIIPFMDDITCKPKQALVQVKSGHVSSPDVRDLRGTMEREHAPLSGFITLEPPTREMLLEATSAGFYHSPGWNREYPRLQILTVEQLLRGAEFKMPQPYSIFKQAERMDGYNIHQHNFKL